MKTLEENLEHQDVRILIKRGLMEDIGKHIKSIYNGREVSVLSDKNVWHIYGGILTRSLEYAGFKVFPIIISPGEQSKSLKTLEFIYNSLLDYGITPSNILLTMGGGVVGDVGGFAASTYMRGIPYVQIPTSLLAQIDSSIGGKVAINLPKGKNLVGSFYHPKLVLIDPDTLKTLDGRFIKDGMSEMIKYGAICDKDLLYDILNASPLDNQLSYMDNWIYICCLHKKKIVEADEKDNGLRMILNFGHTLGHAIEYATNYNTYTHGEAISIGMHVITRKTEDMGLTQKGTADALENILKAYNLPVDLPSISPDKILDGVYRDKKNRDGKLNLVILSSLGKAFIHPITPDQAGKYLLP
ncbi:3-dehydroquinate synthase [Xylanivirga thermophila]|uniref:3-dehydroquinate synthase n=1 Tax=Xylanivirga thermophila TaxID=2496273 RepID=UPI00101B8D68|nr:3-dehydroquinate synthase [Xylanivirga thermophila]